jgi:tetratricopeptide (TPR) repeat protein
MRSTHPTLASLALAWLFALAVPAQAGHSLVERVKDGPAATSIRESYRLLELGEESDDDAAKLDWYARGKQLADLAVRQEPGNAEAHFALFANWGRWLQTDGWLKNSYRLPAVWKELDRTLELNPDHSDALAAKGGMYLQLPRFLGGNVDKAVPLLVRSIELDPRAPGARLELADCYIHQSRVDDARDLATAALRLSLEQGKPRYVRRAQRLLQEIGPRPQHAEASLAGPPRPFVLDQRERPR